MIRPPALRNSRICSTIAMSRMQSNPGQTAASSETEAAGTNGAKVALVRVVHVRRDYSLVTKCNSNLNWQGSP